MMVETESTDEFQYVTGQLRPTFKDLFANFQRANEDARLDCRFETNLAYGSHPRQRLDLSFSVGTTRAVIMYFHAGYWQTRDKAQFHFLAKPLTERGFTVAFVNYPLCPDVSIAELCEAVRGSVPVLAEHLTDLPNDIPWLACGHSAGAHLAVELALSQPDVSSVASQLTGILGISGVYELSPLLHTTLNDKLKLDVSAAIAASPIRRVRGRLPNAKFIVGGDETPAFLEQSRKMAKAWKEAGNPCEYKELSGKDHFSVLCGDVIPDLLEELLDEIDSVHT